MNELISGRNVWSRLTPHISGSTGRRRAAIAYVSSAAPRLLPLRRGDHLIVNASPRSLRSGVTDPAPLRGWHERGVKVWSHEGLHAKVFAADDVGFVGSANASAFSASNSNEAVHVSNVRAVIRSLHNYLDTLTDGATRVGEDFLNLAETQYRPPRTHGRQLVGVDADGPPPGLLPEGPWTIRHADAEEYEFSDRELQTFEEGRRDFRTGTVGFRLNTYTTTRDEVRRWSPYDLLLQSTVEDGIQWVYPPEVFLGARDVPRTTKALAFVKFDQSLDPITLDDLNERLVAAGVRRLGVPVTIADQRRVLAILAAFGLP
jgi:hypothetical protein